MSYNAEQLLDDIIKEIDWVIDINPRISSKWSVRRIEYMIDLYWYKFGVNLRLTNQKVGDFIRLCNKV